LLALVSHQLFSNIYSTNVSKPEENSDAVKRFKLCIFCPVFDAGQDNPSVFYPPVMRLAASFLLAVQHFNNRNCSVLGECPPGLPANESNGIQLEPLLYDLEGFGTSLASISTLSCSQKQGYFSVGVLTSLQSTAITPLADLFGQLVVSSYATSLSLSDKEIYPNFARTVPSSEGMVDAAASFILKMGWRQVAALHNADTFGNSLSEFLDTTLQAHGTRQLARISLGEVQTADNIFSAMQALRNTGFKVVTLFVFLDRIPQIFSTAYEVLAEDFFTYTWILMEGDLEDLDLDAATVEFGGRRRSLMEGIIGLNIRVNEDKARRLKASIEEFQPDFPDALADIVQDARDAETSSDSKNSSFHSMLSDLSTEVAAPLSSAGLPDVYQSASYDAVWLLGMAMLEEAEGTAEAPSVAADVIRSIQEGASPRMSGVSNLEGWDSSGDPLKTTLVISLKNFGQRTGQDGPTHAVIGHWTVQDGFVRDSSSAEIVWSDGSTYPPNLPSDGLEETSNWLVPASIAGAVVLVLLVIVSALAVWKARRLGKRVDSFVSHATRQIDLDSPMQKMIEFLKRYKSSKLFWQRPNRAEASDLLDMVVANSGHLTEPNLETSLDSVNQGIRMFLLGNSKKVVPFTRNDCDEFGSMVSDPVEVMNSNLGRSDSVIKDAFATQAGTVIVPPEIKGRIACDFFLETVTNCSRLASCPNPLLVVIKGALELHAPFQHITYSRRAMSCLMNFMQNIEMGYPDMLYHCKLHAADVTNRLLAITSRTELMGVPIGHKINLGLVAMVAGAVHDYGHPQKNNAFLTSQGHEMAMEFNDQSVAENYSIRQSMYLMREDACNFLDCLVGKQQSRTKRRFRQLVIHMVLGSDMSKHFDILSRFQAQVVDNESLRSAASMSRKWILMDDSQQILTMQMAMKVADLGHCYLSEQQHTEWVYRLEEEFFQQGDAEKQLEMNVSPLMDRNQPGYENPLPLLLPICIVRFFSPVCLPRTS